MLWSYADSLSNFDYYKIRGWWQNNINAKTGIKALINLNAPNDILSRKFLEF